MHQRGEAERWRSRAPLVIRLSQFPPAPTPPTSATFASPWHSPTSTSEPPLLADFVIVGALPAARYDGGAGGA